MSSETINPILKINNLCKKVCSHNTGTEISLIDNISVDIKSGETIAIFGPNGCGKTTFLSILAGIIDSTNGSIFFNTKKEKLSIGYAFQQYQESLYPWLTVFDNISLQYMIKGAPKADQKNAVRELARIFGINLPWNSYPYQLSGGQKQVTALLRCLLAKPQLALLDEPLSAMDFQTSLQLLEKLSSFLKNNSMTSIIISHDIDQALFLADRILVMSPLPMSIKKDFSVPFEYPRTLDIFQKKRFFDLRVEILNIFCEEVKL